MDPTEGVDSFGLYARPTINDAKVKILPLIILSQWCSCYLVSKIQCMGSPRYCFAAVRADILARRSTVTFFEKNDVIG